jgi:hypothetical protein
LSLSRACDFIETGDRIQLWRLQALYENLGNTTLIPLAIKDLLDLIGGDFPIDVVEDPSLTMRLETAYALIAPDFLQAALGALVRFFVILHHLLIDQRTGWSTSKQLGVLSFIRNVPRHSFISTGRFGASVPQLSNMRCATRNRMVPNHGKNQIH